MRSLSGSLLIASPRLPDVNFYRTVVLIIHHDKQGAFGVVLNRPTDHTVGEVWDSGDGPPADASQPIHVGGPVRGPLLALHAVEACSETEVLPGVHFAATQEHLNQIVQTPDQPYRIFAGYSGWAPGQLEGELKLGGWMVLPARFDHVFSDPEMLWRTASQEVGEQITAPLMSKQARTSNPGCN